ncbi:hydrolase [Haemophilus influenzae biotype aegyptius]|uniref:alpha/beta fold hydrolase n=1 Tax=Haemophilus influenzae TaxID=727 RepID=UPI0001F37191|nr:alpha/beta hydrolase [Haemophilus influenzae]QEQ62387.1 alpha/beta hydrolase [Haemophilus influenzae biotype aegyptius]QEQ63899.1 alpha/beta hydrolase [Haemophilus influenzae biotype aegyptius]QEQ65951.1 alpha/beta hydrolase [Haemophilus influenzae biotype aegyptius]TMQ36888.1 hydrolase [Haemophilus influenzae biotype aegyptius]TMQ37067.1 hydrolase [Haemophilus influenzae biotype aegyptius]
MIREPYFHQFALAKLLPFFEQFPTQYLSGKRNIKLAYRHLIQPESAVRKLMILVNGRAENMLKWSELAYDFYHQGYDVLLFDHRGQGYSQRIIHQKGHLDEFRFYVDDMAKIIEKVTALFSYSTQHLLAHSMGALIATYYLANCDHCINKAVLSSPFYGIPLKHPIRDELIITLMNIFGQGERYVFGKGPYQQSHLEYNELSFCKTRMKWMNRVNRKNPAINLGGPTFRWVHLCLNAIKRLPKVIPKIEIPILILQAEKEKIVDNNNLEKLTALFPNARCEVILNAKHEILFEQDKLRKETIFKMLEFLNN